jgi:hypothetical protein
MGLIDSKIRTGQYVIDQENNQLTFLDVRFYMTDNGTFVPSVSTILDAFPKSAAFYDWLKNNTAEESDKIKTEAGEAGSIVHKLSELYDAGEVVSVLDDNGRIKYKAREWNMFEKYVEWCKKFKPNIIQNEFNIVSEAIGTGGTIDKEIELDGKRMLLDLKTSNMIHDTYWMQLAAYSKLYEQLYGRTIDDVCILWVNAKTRTEKYEAGKTYQTPGAQLLFPPKDLDHYWKLFLHCQALWLEVNGTMKPRELVYNLSHSK